MQFLRRVTQGMNGSSTEAVLAWQVRRKGSRGTPSPVFLDKIRITKDLVFKEQLRKVFKAKTLARSIWIGRGKVAMLDLVLPPVSIIRAVSSE